MKVILFDESHEKDLEEDKTSFEDVLETSCFSPLILARSFNKSSKSC